MLGALLSPDDERPGVAVEGVANVLAGEVFPPPDCAAQAQSVKSNIAGKKNLHLFISQPLLATNFGDFAACSGGFAEGRMLS